MGLWYGDSAKDSVVYNYMNPQSILWTFLLCLGVPTGSWTVPLGSLALGPRFARSLQCASHCGGGNLCALGAVPGLYLLGLGRVHVYTY